MLHRLFLAGVCALGLATASAGSALADTTRVAPAATSVQLYIPTSVQFWSPDGLVKTTECPFLTSHRACDPSEWPGIIQVLIDEYGGYRLLARTGRWFEYGGNEDTFNKIEEVDATGGRGWALVIRSEAELDPYKPEPEGGW